MPIKRYTYTGPNSAITVKASETETRDVMLWRNTEVELPDDDEHVTVMVEMGYLTPIGDAAPTATVVTETPAVTTKSKTK